MFNFFLFLLLRIVPNFCLEIIAFTFPNTHRIFFCFHCSMNVSKPTNIKFPFYAIEYDKEMTSHCTKMVRTGTHTQIPFSITYVFVCSQINYTMSDWNPITVLLATVINRCWNVWICHVEWLYLQMVEWAKERVREKKMILPNGKCLANKVKTEWTDNMCVWERGCGDTSVPILKTDCIVYRCI